MALDPQVKQFFLDPVNDSPSPDDLTLAEFRAAVEAMTSFCAPAARDVHARDGTVPSPWGPVPFRVYHPEPGIPRPLVVYFHGGGWMSGGIDYMEPPLRSLATEAGVVVANVGYRLAPEHPYPAARCDAEAVTAWMYENAGELDADPERLVVAGDSAGANLAAVVALTFRGSGTRVGHQLLINPAIDPRMDSASYREFAEGHQNTASMMERCWRTYLDRPEGPLHEVPWQAAPAFVDDLTGAPPTTVITVEYDPLRDEGEHFAARTAAAGVPTTLVRCPGLIHCAMHLDGIAPRAADLRGHAVRALRAAFA